MRVVHVVVAALAPPHPLRVVRVRPVRLGVVVPRGQLDDRARRQHRGRIVGVHVVHVPVEVEVGDVVQHLDPAVRVDRLHRHRLAADVHVRLVVLEPRGQGQGHVGVVHGHLAGRDVEGVHGLPHAEGAAVHAVLGHEALGVEPDPHRGRVDELLAHRMVVVVEGEARARLHQLAGVLAEDVADLAHRELGQVGAPPRHVDHRLVVAGQLLLLQVDDRVVGDAPL